MDEKEMARGEVSKVDQEWSGGRFVLLLAVTLGTALVIIYTIASIKTGDFSWQPFAHDHAQHAFGSSAL